MNQSTALATTPRLWLVRAQGAATRGFARVEAWPVPAVLGGLVVIEWACVLSLARTVHHAGWIYYQGGDQLWYYTLGWLLAHGQLGYALVGYGLPVMFAPIVWIAGPNLVSALPAIILLNVLVFLPVAMFSLYGIAARIGGRLFGYWTLLLWIVAPFVGIAYTNVGYHQRFTELLLPQAFGLTGLADFATMTAALVSLYFCSRIVFADAALPLDGVAAGVAAGAAIAIKPATALFLAGPALAFLYRRRFFSAALFFAGIAPALITLAVWKDRGLGQLPILNGVAPHPVGRGLASSAPIVALNLGHYFQLDWAHLGRNLDFLREEFWSGRVLEWLPVAGLIGLGRVSRTGLLLLGGPFAAFVIVKGTYVNANIEDGSLFRIMMPVFPIFVVMLACVPLLFPHAPRLLRHWRPAFREPRAKVRQALIAGALVLTAIVPLGAFAAANTGKGAADDAMLVAGTMPVPVNIDLGLTTKVSSGGRVMLRWRAADSVGGPAFYRVWRGPAGAGDGFTCPPSAGARLCLLSLPEVGVTHRGSFTDNPGKGRWIYRIAVAANWLDDPQYGDVYLVGRPVRADVP